MGSIQALINEKQVGQVSAWTSCVLSMERSEIKSSMSPIYTQNIIVHILIIFQYFIKQNKSVLRGYVELLTENV